MKQNFSNNLTFAEEERLALLIEECSEVIQAATKILRHGYYSYNPFDKNRKTNKSELEKEIGHVHVATGLLSSNGDVDVTKITESQFQKAGSIDKWLHHNNMS